MSVILVGLIVLVYVVSVLVSCLVIRLHKRVVGFLYEDWMYKIEYEDIVFLVYVPVVNLFVCVCLLLGVGVVGWKVSGLNKLVKKLCGIE